MSLGWVGLGSIRFWFKIVRMNFRLSIGHSKRYSLTRDLTSLIKQCRSHLLFHLRLHRQAYCASVTHCLSLSRIVVILHTKSKHVARSCVKICLAGQGLRGLASAISLAHILGAVWFLSIWPDTLEYLDTRVFKYSPHTKIVKYSRFSSKGGLKYSKSSI
jgi:hypothetical protein